MLLGSRYGCNTMTQVFGEAGFGGWMEAARRSAALAWDVRLGVP
jgi:hypothetical protein